MANELPVLAGVGIRALVESVCNEKKASGSNLAQRIDSLVPLGILTRDAAKTLHSLRILGNRAAHEVKPHSIAKLRIALDIAENLLTNVYVIPHQAKSVLDGDS